MSVNEAGYPNDVFREYIEFARDYTLNVTGGDLQTFSNTTLTDEYGNTISIESLGNGEGVFRNISNGHAHGIQYSNGFLTGYGAWFYLNITSNDQANFLTFWSYADICGNLSFDFPLNDTAIAPFNQEFESLTGNDLNSFETTFNTTSGRCNYQYLGTNGEYIRVDYYESLLLIQIDNSQTYPETYWRINTSDNGESGIVSAINFDDGSQVFEYNYPTSP